jgi:glucose/mannose-6-phosphate isomerase
MEVLDTKVIRDEGVWAYEKWLDITKDACKIKVSVPDKKDFNCIAICGMGGSGVSGYVIKDWLRYKISKPIIVINDYKLPSYITKKSLVIVASVSGNTEESISCLNEAILRNCSIATLSAGGKIKEISLEKGISYTKIKLHLNPRASLPYLLIPQVNILKNCEVIDEEFAKDEIKKVVNELESLKVRISADSPTEKNIAKQLALFYYNSYLAVYCSSSMKSIAHRFKSSVNENAKMPVQVELMPELCHNEIESWEYKNKDRKVIFIRSKFDHKRIAKRFNIIKKIIKEDVKVKDFWVNKQGLAGLLGSIYTLDFSSIYAAVLRRVDSVPIRLIDRMKELLSKD